jgi:hypothetical protein
MSGRLSRLRRKRYLKTLALDHPDIIAIFTLLLLAVAHVLLQAQHDFLIPPFENDFSGFAQRAASVGNAVEWNGFYPLGYPLSLWLLTLSTGSTLASAKIVALLSALLLAGSAYLITQIYLGKTWSLLALFLLVANPYFWQWSLLLGTDLAWAALQMLAIWLVLRALHQRNWRWLIAAGAALGWAYLYRYTALIMLLVMGPVLWLTHRFRDHQQGRWKGFVGFVTAFLIVASPQLFVSWRATGNPFFNLQAKNVWFGIYGQGDWLRNWDRIGSDITLWQVIRLDPARFLRHWAIELGKLGGYSGVVWLGLSRIVVREMTAWGQALSLGIAGGLGLCLLVLGRRSAHALARWPASVYFLGTYYILYGASIALVFVQPRFLLPFIPILAALTALLLRHMPSDAARLLTATLLIFGLLNSILTVHRLLDELQPPVDQVVAHLEAHGIGPHDVILGSFIMPYAYHTGYAFHLLPDEIDGLTQLQIALAEKDAQVILYDDEYGPRYWPALSPLLTPAQAPPYLELLLQSHEPNVVLYRFINER